MVHFAVLKQELLTFQCLSSQNDPIIWLFFFQVILIMPSISKMLWFELLIYSYYFSTFNVELWERITLKKINNTLTMISQND